MPRVDLTVTSGTSQNPTTGAVMTMTAADTTNKERFVLTGREILVIHNTGASTRTYTVTSVADPFGRSGDVSAVNILAGAIHLIGPFGLDGWRQSSGGYLHIEASHAEVKFGVYRMP